MPIRQAAVLVVEDDSDLSRLLKFCLHREGYRVFVARTSGAAVRLARRHKPALVIMDAVRPRMDGIEIMRRLRREADVPIIFLTGRKKEADSLLAFSHGADDYVTKPFSMDNLLARVKAVLRRDARTGGAGAEPLFLGELALDLERREIRVKGRPVALAPKEFELLWLLATAGGKALSRSHILERLWGYERGGDASTRTVDQHVARLRRKLRSEGARIVTLRRFGYKLKRP